MSIEADLWHDGPWSEEDFLALPDDRRRVQLLDGELLTTPSASLAHQRLSFRLCAALDALCPSGLEVLEAVNVRLGPSRILIPNVAISTVPGLEDVVLDARDVALVAEIASPGSVASDRAVKPQLYAAAGIPIYLRLELPGPVAVVHTLVDGRYVAGPPRLELVLAEPFPASIDLAALLERRR